MGELSQDDQEVSNGGPGEDPRPPVIEEAAHPPAGIDAAQDPGAAPPPSYSTGLIGRRRLFQEGLARVLDTAGFQVVASAASVDQLDLIDLQRHQAVLLIVDAGDDAEMAIRQMQSFKQPHPAARIAVLTQTDRMADIASLFEA